MSRIQIVCQVGLTSIGFDEPRLSVDIDMRPTTSLADWLQRRGRVGRAYPARDGDRSYQTAAILRTRAEMREGRNPVLVMPCGAGKSWIACKIAKLSHERGKSIGFVTVRRALVDDLSARLTAFSVPHGIVMNGRDDTGHPTKVASIHTVAKRGIVLDVSCLFLDEGHLLLSEEFRAVVERHKHIPRVVLTATPWRADGLGLSGIADSIILGPSAQELIDLGFLVPTRVFTRSVPDTGSIPVNASGEFNEPQLASLMGGAQIAGNAVKEWLYRANGRPTIVHAVNRAHSESISARFRAAGVNAVSIDADTPDAERKRVFDDMCQDAPPKAEALLLDLAGNCLRFGFPEDPRDWSIDSSVNAPRQPHAAATSVRRCSKCWFTFRATVDRCPECGNPHVPTQAQIREKDVALSEMKRAKKEAAITKYAANAGHSEQVRKLADLLATAQAKSYRRGWCFGRFRAIFKSSPPQEVIRDAYAAIRRQ